MMTITEAAEATGLVRQVILRSLQGGEMPNEPRPEDGKPWMLDTHQILVLEAAAKIKREAWVSDRVAIRTATALQRLGVNLARLQRTPEAAR